MRTTDHYGSARWAGSAERKGEGILDIPADRLGKGGEAGRRLLFGEAVDTEALLKGIRQETDGSFSKLATKLGAAVPGGPGAQSLRTFLGWGGDGHVLTVAPTRAGKGVGLVVPNLLNYAGSVLVVDPKGENWAVTHRWRKEGLGQRVVCLDPFHAVLPKGTPTDSINPLDGLVDYSKGPETYLKQNPELLDEAAMIADAMIVRPADEKDPHWNDKCRTLLKGLILAVVYGVGPGGRRHLGAVREMLTSGLERLQGFFPFMEKCKANADGVLGRAAREISTMGREEFKNVVSFALKQTEFLDSPLAAECLGGAGADARGTFDLRGLKTGEPVSIYLVLPPHYLAQYARLFRLWITMAMAAMTRTSEPPRGGLPVLFLLDEMAQLGTMDMMRKAVSLMAGYGMTLWMVWQDLSQLKLLYKEDWQSFLANAKIQQYFGINDPETARTISEMLGEETIRIETVSESTSSTKENLALFKGSKTKNTARSNAEAARALLKSDEVRRLPRETMLLFAQGLAPVACRRLSYFNDPAFAGRFDSNPYFKG